MSGDFIDSELQGLSFVALYQLAAFYDKQATIIRAEAMKQQARAEGENQVDRRLKFLEQLPDTVMKYLRQGRALHVAMQLAAEHSGVPLATVEARWQTFIEGRTEHEKQKRRNLIVALAELRLTNAEIAARVGLKHENSVSRILSQERRRRLVFDRAVVAVLDEARAARKPEKPHKPVLLTNT